MPPLTSFELETQAQTLLIGWVRHFRQQDTTLCFTRAEQAHTLVIRAHTRPILLAGIIDAEGDDFFLEAKTANPRSAKHWKPEWLLSPQALTYGLLTGGKKRYLVRKAFKATTPTYDHEWFKFSPGDLDMWYNQLLTMQREIEEYSYTTPPWPLNLAHGCFAFGPNYPCPFWQNNCTRHDYNTPPAGATDVPDGFSEFTGPNRNILLSAIAAEKNPLVLTATRIKDWMRCRELYRRMRVLSFAPSEAMLLGSRFHELLAAYHNTLITTQEKQNG